MSSSCGGGWGRSGAEEIVGDGRWTYTYQMHRTVLSATFSVLCLLSAAGCGSSETAIPADEARSELINRNWIDVWPESKDDRLHVLRFVPSMGGGVYQDRNVFEGAFELFTFEATGEEIRFVFPGRGESKVTGYRIERVEGPAPFNRRLVLDDSPRGPAVYYGYDEGQTASPLGLSPVALR